MITARPSTNGQHRCLEGYIVLDLTQYLSGPYCTFILGALGATVIKVEPRGTGDGNRHQPPFVSANGLRGEKQLQDDIGLAFLKRNACKHSVAIDLKDERGHTVLLRLARSADACVHNFRPGVAEKLGVDAASLRAVNQGLVYCEISGYGPYATDRQGVVDTVVQAVSGLMAFTGQAEGEPTRCSTPIADQAGGVFGAIAVLAGLLQRDGGRGSDTAPVFGVSMLQALSSMVWDEHHDVYKRQGESERIGNGTQRSVPFNTYRTKDGRYVAICAVSPLEWKRLVEATGIPQFSAHAEWGTLAIRVKDRQAIDRLLQEWASNLTRDEAMGRLVANGVTAGPVYGIADILEDRRFVETVLYPVQHPVYGAVDALNARFPIIVDNVQVGPYARPAPQLGGDSISLLQRYASLGMPEIDQLVRAGVVGTAGAVRPNEETDAAR